MKRAARASESPLKRQRRSRALVNNQIGYDTDSDDDEVATQPGPLAVHPTPASNPSSRVNNRPWAHPHTGFSGIGHLDEDEDIPSISDRVTDPSLLLDPSLRIPDVDLSLDNPTSDTLASEAPHETFGPNPDKPRRPQGQSHRISQVLAIIPDIQARILATFSHPHLSRPCACGAAAIYRCVDCFNAPLWCRACIVREHRYNPFHHIEHWDGRMFVRDALATQRPFDKTKFPVEDVSNLHLLMQMHLAEASCPHRRPHDPEIVEFTIADHNGFHTRWLEFCQCLRPQDYKRWQQLVAVRLFPASFEQPQTAFTFTVMKQFYVHSLASKKSAYDYVKALCQLSNNTAPQTVTNRYREFMFACRIWRFLTLQRRTGQAHGIDAWVPHRRRGCLALRCPACPEVGFNITAEELANAREDERHKYTLNLSADGNFKLQLKKKTKSDPDDFALNDGNTYFPGSEDFKEYEKLIKTEKAEELESPCDHLNAAKMQKISKFKNAVISGVVAVQCARHGFYMPQGMVNLKAGEGYGYTDYAVVHSLADHRLQRWIRLGYDIWCHYVVHLLDRIGEWFPDMLATVAKVDGAINKLHVLTHKELCQVIYNLNWMPYAGLMSMEMIETGWAVHNLTAASIREMNYGNRLDSIDGTSDHFNWEKTIRLTEALTRLYRVAKSEQRAREASFKALDAFHRNRYPDAVPKWETENEKPYRKDGVWHSVFQLKLKSGPPTHAAAYTKLLAKELAETQAGGGKPGDLGLVSAALAVERDREHFKRMKSMPTSTEESKQAAIRQLGSDIKALRKLQLDRFPELHRYMKNIDNEDPTAERLLLPSDFSAVDRERLKLNELGQIEYKLREGQAHDYLGDLRKSIRTKNFNTGLKISDIQGTAATTRAGNFLKVLQNDVQIAGDGYRRAWRALRALGLPKDDRTLQPLSRNDQWGKGGKGLKLSRSKDREPWFWSAQRPAGLDEKGILEWEEEMDRVQWFRERALYKRANEEVEIVEEDFGRTIQSFTRNSEIWTNMAEQERQGDYDDEHGWRAYAHKQAVNYDNLGGECKMQYARLPQLVAQDELDEVNKANKDEEERERDAEEEPDYKEDYLCVVE